VPTIENRLALKPLQTLMKKVHHGLRAPAGFFLRTAAIAALISPFFGESNVASGTVKWFNATSHGP
jgi:hypothetical protein